MDRDLDSDRRPSPENAAARHDRSSPREAPAPTEMAVPEGCPCRYSDYRGRAAKRERAARDDLPARASRAEIARPKAPTRPRDARPREPRPVSEQDLELLAEVGRFRVIRARTLEQVFFAGHRRACSDALLQLRSDGLIEDRLVRQRARTPGGSPVKIHLISLTREGKKLVTARPGHDRAQAIYAGLVKEREALHDSNLYPVYRAHAARLKAQGATIRRVVLDFELKRVYLRELRRREKEHPNANREILQRAVAAQFALPVLDGRVQFPDLRIEYETPGAGIARADIELATASYHHRHIAQKARAGFTIYADPGERGRLGPTILDDHDLMAGILSF
ncbi:MAG: hypothetical protein ACRD04_05350 [Terriglobales bacterium]